MKYINFLRNRSIVLQNINVGTYYNTNTIMVVIVIFITEIFTLESLIIFLHGKKLKFIFLFIEVTHYKNVITFGPNLQRFSIESCSRYYLIYFFLLNLYYCENQYSSLNPYRLSK